MPRSPCSLTDKVAYLVPAWKCSTSMCRLELGCCQLAKKNKDVSVGELRALKNELIEIEQDE